MDARLFLKWNEKFRKELKGTPATKLDCVPTGSINHFICLVTSEGHAKESAALQKKAGSLLEMLVILHAV